VLRSSALARIYKSSQNVVAGVTSGVKLLYHLSGACLCFIGS